MSDQKVHAVKMLDEHECRKISTGVMELYNATRLAGLNANAHDALHKLADGILQMLWPSQSDD